MRNERGTQQLSPAKLAALLFLLMACLPLMQLAAAPDAELWPRWQAHDPDSRTAVDHSGWQLFLDRSLVRDHPDGVNRVDYQAVASRDRQLLQDYLARMQEVAVDELNRDEQLAFWTNLYNAVTVELILEHYPVASIRDINISGSIFNRHPWDAELITVAGTALTLNDIEHRILRPLWQDPRIHYAVNCASIGCPNLRAEAFTAADWDAQYEAAAREFIQHERAVTFVDSFSGPRPQFSSIYDWYQEDFGGSVAGVVDHLLQYAEGETRRRLQEYAKDDYSPRPRFDYNWDLNEG